MVKMKGFKISCPNVGLLFLIAGMAVGNYSYETYQQKYLNRNPKSSSQQAEQVNIAGSSEDDKILPIPAVDQHLHPLDPLTALEMQLAARIVRSYNGSSDWQFKCIGLREPDKNLMVPYFQTRTTPPPGMIPRRANVLIVDPVERTPISTIVNLSAGTVEAWKIAKPGEKIGAITAQDEELTSNIVFSHPEIMSRLKAKGYNGRSEVIAEVWDGGYVADNPNYSQARKLVLVFFYGIRPIPGNNFYAHPLDFTASVELGANVVRGIDNLPIQQGFDTSDRRGDSIPTAESEYFSDLLPSHSIRHDLNRLLITQPGGPSFKLEGKELTWLDFALRIGYNPREGFYLYTITINDNGKIRPLIYRLSMSEAYLSYGEPRPPYHRKVSYDMGNGEFGSRIRQLPVHQFCRGKPVYFDSDQHNEKGETWIIQNSLCIVEEDAGVLWAHHDDISEKKEAIRNQRLVISSLFTYANIDYWISWRLYQDATIELAIKITGVQTTNLMAVDVKPPPYGNLMKPQLYDQAYQHFFAVRIDADIDGLENTVSVEDIVRVSERVSRDNPYGNGITTRSVDLTTPAQAATDWQPNRYWKISNPNIVSSLSGKPSSWNLIPQGSRTPSMLTPDSPMIPERLAWTKHNMWVLPYDVDHIYASGLYLNCGVDKWTGEEANVNITNTDVVLFHVFNYVYIPEVDDWPILSSLETVGFRLRPSNFFNQNHALYAPRASETTLLDGVSLGSLGVPANAGGWKASPEL